MIQEEERKDRNGKQHRRDTHQGHSVTGQGDAAVCAGVIPQPAKKQTKAGKIQKACVLARNVGKEDHTEHGKEAEKKIVQNPKHEA